MGLLPKLWIKKFQKKIILKTSWLYLVLFSLLLSACSKKNGGNTTQARSLTKVLDQLEENRLDFKSFSSSLKVKVDSDQIPIDRFTLILRMQKDSIIWVSGRMLSIEGVRAQLTPDSFKMVDRINKRYLVGPYSKAQEMLGFPVDFGQLQSMILGNPIILSTDSIKLLSENPYKKLISTQDGLESTLTLEKESNNLVYQRVKDEPNNREGFISFKDYIELQNKPFSQERHMELKGKDKILVDFTFNKIKVNEQTKFPFSISSSYQKME